MKALLLFLLISTLSKLQARLVEYPEGTFEIPDDMVQENYSDPLNLTMRRFMRLDLKQHSVIFVVSSIQEETGGKISLATLRVQESFPTEDIKKSYHSYYQTLGPVWTLGPIESIKVDARNQKILIDAPAQLMSYQLKNTEVILPLNDESYFAVNVLCDQENYQNLRSTIDRIIESCRANPKMRLTQ